MSRVLILGEREREQIARVAAYAEEHVIGYVELLRMAKEQEVVGAPLERRVIVPMGYGCAFSIEEHKPGEWYRHLSVSILEEDGQGGIRVSQRRAPAVEAVLMIAEAFGMGEFLMSGSKKYLMYPEGIVHLGAVVINMMTKVADKNQEPKGS